MAMTADLPPIPVGTTFAVPYPSAYVTGIVLASVTGRIFCSMFGPPLRQLTGAALSPSSVSRFMVDDAALHDGSWPITGRIEEPPSPIRVPRFKTTLKDGRPAFAVYSPETFHVVQIVAALPGEEREYERSYLFVLPDIATFECSVAVTFALLAKDTKAPQPESEDVAQTRLLVGLIRSRLKDVTRPRAIDFVADFPNKTNARRAWKALRTDGVSAKIDSGWFARSASVTATKEMLPAYPVIAIEVERFRNFFARFDGVYDGFGTQVDRS
jgi:hypothetical protein